MLHCALSPMSGLFSCLLSTESPRLRQAGYCRVVDPQDVIKVHFSLLRAIDLNMMSGGNGLGKIFLDFKERSVLL